jgi:hypothetical protein
MRLPESICLYLRPGACGNASSWTQDRRVCIHRAGRLFDNGGEGQIGALV